MTPAWRKWSLCKFICSSPTAVSTRNINLSHKNSCLGKRDITRSTLDTLTAQEIAEVSMKCFTLSRSNRRSRRTFRGSGSAKKEAPVPLASTSSLAFDAFRRSSSGSVSSSVSSLQDTDDSETSSGDVDDKGKKPKKRAFKSYVQGSATADDIFGSAVKPKPTDFKSSPPTKSKAVQRKLESKLSGGMDTLAYRSSVDAAVRKRRLE